MGHVTQLVIIEPFSTNLDFSFFSTLPSPSILWASTRKPCVPPLGSDQGFIRGLLHIPVVCVLRVYGCVMLNHSYLF